MARANTALVEQAQALAGMNRYAFYVAEMLADVDAELLVLHPGQLKSFRVVAEGVRINFQLFDFLQAELIGDPDLGKLAPDWPPAPADAELADEADLPPGYDMAAWTLARVTSR